MLPQVKTREQNARVSFKEFDLSPQTGRLIEDYAVSLKLAGLGRDSPLFPEAVVLTRQKSLDDRDETDLFLGHCTAAGLSRVFNNMLNPIAPPTERLDFAPLPISPKRFRYTFGTRMVEEGASKTVVADRLGHTDLQNVDHYYEASPKIVENIDKAMDSYLAPLAQAFRGRLVEGEGQTTLKGAPGSRIIDFKAAPQPVGSCSGKAGGCAFNKPVACYTCFKFEPWLDAPHEKVLQRLLAEREKWPDDERIARINDDAILAVQQVIVECTEVKSQRQPESVS